MRPLQPPPALHRWGPPGGPWVLALHGLPTGGQLAGPLGGALAAAGVGLVAPDLPGYGATPPLPPGPLTVARHADWLEALLDRLPGPPPVAVLGHDYGGLLGAALVLRGRAPRLALSSAVTDRGWAFARLTALPLLERYFYRAHAGRLYLRLGVVPGRQDALARLFLDQTRSPRMPGRMRETARGLSMGWLGALPARLRATGAPLLALWGADDPFFRPRAARRICRKHGDGARLVLIAGARHFVWWDRPAACARVVAGWLAETGAWAEAGGPGAQRVPKARSPASPSPGRM